MSAIRDAAKGAKPDTRNACVCACDVNQAGLRCATKVADKAQRLPNSAVTPLPERSSAAGAEEHFRAAN